MVPRRRSPNEHLIGIPGSRSRIATPALVLDLDALERNIGRMAEYCAKAGISLRPHGKTHKSVAIATRQLAAGAVGICAATLGEAEAFAEAGIAGILICAPQVGIDRAERLARLNATARDLMVVVDHVAQIEALEKALKAAGAPPMKVMIDVDLGLHRTGAPTLEDVVHLAKRLRSSSILVYAGLQAYAGELQHVLDHAERKRRAVPQFAFLKQVIIALANENLRPRIVSGGGTGTHALDPGFGLFTELQAGSYVVMDAHYNRVQFTAGDNRPPFETSLFVRTTVISANHPLQVTTDAGLKRFATDSGEPEIAGAAPAGAVYAFRGDEYGAIKFKRPEDRFALGHSLECVTPHCDPTINLYDWYHCMRGDTLVEIWPVDARGA